MRVRVLFFGVLREGIGRAEEMVEVETGLAVGGLLDLLAERAPQRSELWTRLAVAVNREYAGRATVLAEGDEVALLPPVSGGRSGQGRIGAPRV